MARSGRLLEQGFSAIRPDWRLAKLLFTLKGKNTEALIGGVAKILADEGINLVDSTLFLKPLLCGEGVQTKRKPNADEVKEIRYGRDIANAVDGAKAQGYTPIAFSLDQAVNDFPADANRRCW